ncbi:MAG: hypothetical protein L6246_09975 [Thermodesulfovibrionales bacterium]|nr:hypothetical protein [Nitrospinota bacterium]MCG2710625.1 hypothetical protein [Thermodesulfovibrionales bacterium]
MSTTYFKNQLRGNDVVVATLQAFSKDICRRCIGLSGAQTKVIKGLKKLRMDLDKTSIPDDDKREIMTHIDTSEKSANSIEIEEECECQKTAGNCKIGPGCLALGALELIKEITEPPLEAKKEEVSKAEKGEVSKVAKLVCEKCGAEEPVPIVH